MNESNRRIASLNRIDELNQRIAFQNDPLIVSWAAKTVPKEPKSSHEQPKTPSRRPTSTLRPSKEGPRTPNTAQDSLRSPLGTVLGPPWDQPITRSKTRSLEVNGRQGLGVDFWLPKWVPKRPQDYPKAIQNSRRQRHHFSIALGPVLRRSWAHLGGILSHFALVLSNDC